MSVQLASFDPKKRRRALQEDILLTKQAAPFFTLTSGKTDAYNPLCWFGYITDAHHLKVTPFLFTASQLAVMGS